MGGWGRVFDAPAPWTSQRGEIHSVSATPDVFMRLRLTHILTVSRIWGGSLRALERRGHGTGLLPLVLGFASVVRWLDLQLNDPATVGGGSEP